MCLKIFGLIAVCAIFSAVAKQDYEYKYGENVMLECLEDADNRTYTYTWKKGDTAVKDIKADSSQEFQLQANGSLVIKHPSRSAAGVYTCTAQYEEAGKILTTEINVSYFAEPKVLPFDKSKNLVQDERLVVECKVLGFPMPVITWFKEDQQIKAQNNSHFKLSAANTYDGKKIENGKLEVSSVEFDDAGEYKCMATNSKWPKFNSTETILVRVKDKLAALWPFLGIVAEVVVLCTIIFIYEKKRNKDAAMEEDANDDGLSAEKKAEGVRHRGSPNNVRT